ncbi:MAG: GNAT family N-acetyltransferase, partial [Nitrospiraceae bacterium]
MTHSSEARSPRIIRPYDEGDREAAVRMLADSDPWKTLGYTETDLDSLFDTMPQGREAIVIEHHGSVAGLALLRQRFLMGDYLELLVIAPTARGKGLGRALLTYLEGLVFARAKNLFVCVSDFNKEARRFYQKHGYQEIGPMPNFLIPGSAEIL